MTHQGFFAGLMLAVLNLPVFAAGAEDLAGFFRSQDKLKEASAWKKAADKGSAMARVELGLMLWEQGSKAEAEALIHFRTAAAQGVASARGLSIFYDSDKRSSLQSNPEKFVATLTELARAGDPISQVSLGISHYQDGWRL